MTDELPTHRRTVTIEGVDLEGGFELTGTLMDERPWASSPSAVPLLHHLSLTLRIDAATMTITDARAIMHTYPHEECPSIEPAFRSLIGLSIMRGYTRAVQERLGRQCGCSHLEFLARAMGPAAIQLVSSSARRRGVTAIRPDEEERLDSWLVNTCHLWADGGVGFEKESMNWHPGSDRYPAPSVDELRRRHDA